MGTTDSHHYLQRMLPSRPGTITRAVTHAITHTSRRAALSVGLSLAAASALHAQIPAAPTPIPGGRSVLAAPGSDVTISLLTMGNGTNVWELFGHSGIWIHDNTTGRDTVFNWGVFNMKGPGFIPNFLKGLNYYEMGGETLGQVLDEYHYFDRTVVAQRLDLTAPEKDSLLAMIRVNARPENIKYRYDYFRDNCATKPRDMLDSVLGGLLRTHATAPAGSYRWHALRLMQGDKLLVTGVDIGLGEPADRPITVWEAMFLPKQLHDLVATLQVPDSAGAMHPLVAREDTLFRADRPPEFVAPPNLMPWLWLIGLAIGALFAWLGTRALTGSRGAQVATSIAFAIWSVVTGLLGVVLTLLWTVTDHIFAHANETLLLFNPLWLVLAVLLPPYIMRRRAEGATRAFTFGLAGLAALALAAHVIFLSRQQNVAVIGLALPPALAIAWVVWRGGRESSNGG